MHPLSPLTLPALPLLLLLLIPHTYTLPLILSSPLHPAYYASPSTYYLKTHVISGDKTSTLSKDNLYLTAYHTGAGTNAATFQPTNAYAFIGFLNGTYQQFKFGETNFPWMLSMGYETYAGWAGVAIDGGFESGSEGFGFAERGLVSREEGFDGWLVCDWWHGVPQLFWKYKTYDYPLPTNCALVELYAEAVEAGEEAE